MEKTKNLRKLILNIVLVIMLVICFLITTYAITKDLISIDDNFFKTGKIKINLNDGQPIINEDEYLFEPGMTVMKEFFIENQSTFDVYYKVYFTDIYGDLAETIEVTIKDSDKTIYKGTIKDLTKKNVKAVDKKLKVNEKVFLNAYFHYPKESQNQTQNSNISFKVGVDAVQTKNNPNKLFD